MVIFIEMDGWMVKHYACLSILEMTAPSIEELDK